jgi:hypothetical protein
MCARHSTKLALVITCCVVALSAGGAALARTPGQPNATSSTAPLYNRVLQLGDLEGFWSVTCPVAVTSATQWAMHTASAAQLSSNGFMNGLREPLRTGDSETHGWSIVAQFSSTAGAQREALAELGQARALGAAISQFDVSSIPGSHGYSLPDGSGSRIAVVFTEGRFQYLIEITGAGRSDATALGSRLAAAALTLYRRSQTLG